MRGRIVGGGALLVLAVSLGAGSCSSDGGGGAGPDAGSSDATLDAPAPITDATTDADLDATTDAGRDAGGPIPHGLCHPTSGLCWVWPRPFAEDVAAGCSTSPTSSFAAGMSGSLYDQTATSWVADSTLALSAPAQLACSGGAPYVVGPGGPLRRIPTGWVSAGLNPDREGKLCGVGAYGVGLRFTGVWALAANDVWATSRHMHVAGCAQAFYRYDGVQWIRYDVAETVLAGPVYGAGASDVWSVGTSFMHWDGAAWTEVASPAPGTPYAALHGSGATNVWAVGKGGAIARWGGASWSVVASPITDDLRSVFVASPTRAWATGGGKLLAWDGVAWSVDPTLGAVSVSSVWGTGPSDLWVGVNPGASGTYRPANLLHWDGVAWKGMETTPIAAAQTAMYGVVHVADDDVWAFGDTTVHFDGRDARVSPLPGDADGWRWSARAGTLWVLGVDRVDGSRSLSRWNGAAWSAVAPPVSAGKHVDDVAADASGHAFVALALGEAGPTIAAELYAGDGATWSPVATTGPIVDSLAFGVLSMYAAGPGDLWLVTRDARIHHVVGGAATTFDATLGSHEPSRILGVFGGSVYVFNTVLGTLRFDGATWSTVSPEIGGSYAVNRVQMVSPTEIWLALAEGMVRRFDGASWSDVAGLPRSQVAALAVDSRGALWVGGGGGLFRRPPPGQTW